jgi:FKBP12-rapamycin complex-associated protein
MPFQKPAYLLSQNLILWILILELLNSKPPIAPQLLTALEFGAEGSREQSARLFGHVILACHHLIKPYVAPVLQAILPKLCDCNPNVSANVLKTVGVLSRVGSQEVLKRRDEIFPIVIDALQDQSSSMKREVSLRTLGVLIQSTGYVIEPFERCSSPTKPRP